MIEITRFMAHAELCSRHPITRIIIFFVILQKLQFDCVIQIIQYPVWNLCVRYKTQPTILYIYILYNLNIGVVRYSGIIIYV